MKRNKYTSNTTKLSFWFLEFKKAVQLLNDGKSYDEIKELSEKENIFGAPSPKRAAEMCRAVLGRVEALDSSFYPLFIEGDITTQKQFALAGNLAYDTLLFDFVYEVIREKIIIGSNEVTDADMRIFFNRKREEDERASKYTDYTIVKLISAYKTQLQDAGLLEGKRGSDTRRILKPILSSEVRNWLMDFGYEPILKALEGIR